MWGSANTSAETTTRRDSTARPETPTPRGNTGAGGTGAGRPVEVATGTSAPVPGSTRKSEADTEANRLRTQSAIRALTTSGSSVPANTRARSASARIRSVCSEASWTSRACSMAIAAWPANASASSWSRALNGRRARKLSAPITRPPIFSGTPR